MILKPILFVYILGIEDFSFRTDGKFDMEKCVAHLKRLAQVTIQLNPHVRVFYTVENDNQSTRIEWVSCIAVLH